MAGLAGCLRALSRSSVARLRLIVPSRDRGTPMVRRRAPRRSPSCINALQFSVLAPLRTAFVDDLAPRLLPGPGEPPPADGRRRAAVAVLLHIADIGPRVLLMKRAVRAGDPWSGHVSLP